MSDKLLTPRQVTQCKQLSMSESANSARATALLCIHAGNTQTVAADTSGLTLGQVRYIISRFRSLGMTALNFKESVQPLQKLSEESEKETTKETKPKDKKNKKGNKGKKAKKEKAEKNKKKTKKDSKEKKAKKGKEKKGTKGKKKK